MPAKFLKLPGNFSKIQETENAQSSRGTRHPAEDSEVTNTRKQLTQIYIDVYICIVLECFTPLKRAPPLVKE